MFIIFLVIPIIAAKSIDVTNNNVKPTGMVIQISECFPFCGVAAQLKDNFRPCFPFCHVPVFQMGNLLIVEELPSCFPMCGDQGFSKVLGKNDSRKPTETSPMSTSSLFGGECFPYCSVSVPDFETMFPSCFPFCGVSKIAYGSDVQKNFDENAGVLIQLPDCWSLNYRIISNHVLNPIMFKCQLDRHS